MGDRIHRHDSLRDALFSAAQSTALVFRKEMPSLVPGSASRPADVFLPTRERGQPGALDVTVVSTLQNRTVVRAASVSGYSLSVARERKMAAHSETCQSVGVSFVPMVVETLGGWDEEAVRSVQSLPSVARRVNAWEFHHQTLHDTCSSALLSVFGRETPACGSVALRCILLQLTGRADLYVFVFVLCFCAFFVFYFIFCLF